MHGRNICQAKRRDDNAHSKVYGRTRADVLYQRAQTGRENRRLQDGKVRVGGKVGRGTAATRQYVAFHRKGTLKNVKPENHRKQHQQ